MDVLASGGMHPALEGLVMVGTAPSMGKGPTTLNHNSESYQLREPPARKEPTMARDRRPPTDIDVGPSAKPTEKRAEPLEDKEERDAEREGLRELDEMVEADERLTRARKALERSLPKSGAPPSIRPQKFPADTRRRKLTVYRQRELNKTRTATARRPKRIPIRAARALSETFSSPPDLFRLNQSLSENFGDVRELPEEDAVIVRNIDRYISDAEAQTNAEHIVYVNLDVPDGVSASNIENWLTNAFTEGEQQNFDRYTVASHEISAIANERIGWHPMLEIRTSRGAYLGRAPKGNNTNGNADHVLPRGMKLKVVGSKLVSYTASDGSDRHRPVLQLEDY